MSQAGSYIYLKSDLRSRPLWSIYISILDILNQQKITMSSRPLWGIYISIRIWNNGGTCRGASVLVPYGVSIFLFVNEYKLPMALKEFSSPMGYLYFYSKSKVKPCGCQYLVLVPYGVSIFLFSF